MSKTPRTDAVQDAASQLPFGSVVEVPDYYPPHDPWDLARELEETVNMLRGQLKNCVLHLEGVSRRRPPEQRRHEACITSANKALEETLYT